VDRRATEVAKKEIRLRCDEVDLEGIEGDRIRKNLLD
jgi:hypothetical protein